MSPQRVGIGVADIPVFLAHQDLFGAREDFLPAQTVGGHQEHIFSLGRGRLGESAEHKQGEDQTA